MSQGGQGSAELPMVLKGLNNKFTQTNLIEAAIVSTKLLMWGRKRTFQGENIEYCFRQLSAVSSKNMFHNFSFKLHTFKISTCDTFYLIIRFDVLCN